MASGMVVSTSHSAVAGEVRSAVRAQSHQIRTQARNLLTAALDEQDRLPADQPEASV